MLNGLYILNKKSFDLIYGPAQRRAIAELVNIPEKAESGASLAAAPEKLRDVDVVFSGWGMPVVDEAFLAAAPKLKAIFYGAGAAGGWITDAVAARGITVTSAQVINSIPVAEYTLAMTLLSLKRAFSLAREVRGQHGYSDRNDAPGCYGSTVGLISFGEVAKLVRERLRHFDLNVIVFDPFLKPEDAAALGVEAVSMEDLFARADVVSLHTPLLPETVGLINGTLFESMKPGATFINTARGAVVREEEMLDVLARRPDLQAILDVTHPEPPRRDSRLFTLPNVMLTPHIAGSVGRECNRMGDEMAEELRRYLRGEPLKYALDLHRTAHTSNRPKAAKPPSLNVPA